MNAKQTLHSTSELARVTKEPKCLYYSQTRTFINFFVPDVGGSNKKSYRDRKLIGYVLPRLKYFVQWRKSCLKLLC